MARLAEVNDFEGAARYIGNYLNMQSYRVRKYIMSAGWVFPGWVDFSRWFKREFGDYPPREMMFELSRVSMAKREENTWFGLYLWEKRQMRLRIYEFVKTEKQKEFNMVKMGKKKIYIHN
jgi:hypothetical protein